MWSFFVTTSCCINNFRQIGNPNKIVRKTWDFLGSGWNRGLRSSSSSGACVAGGESSSGLVSEVNRLGVVVEVHSDHSDDGRARLVRREAAG